MTVGQLLAATSSRELSEWQALYRLEYEEREVSPEILLARKAKAKLESKRKR